MRFSLPSVAQWRSGVIAAVTRFPWNMLCAATGAACAIVAIHAQHNDWLEGQCARLAMTAALGMPLFFSLRMLRERTPPLQRWPIEIAGVVLLAIWFFAQPPRPFDSPTIVMIRWLLLLAALHFFAAVAGYMRANERIGFWQFNRRLFLRFCLATLYTGVLVIGLELALLSADKLFELKLGKAYADLWFLMVALFHPAFFLAGVPRDFGALEADDEYPRGLKAFTQFALAPLVAVYTAILYAYAAKILAGGHWPRGWVALPVLLLSGIGILTFLLLYPLRTREEQKWARWFTTNFPRALGPLGILLLLSVNVRIAQYGVTEERYLAIVAALWIMVWSIIFIVRRGSGIRWVPASLTVICAVAAFGPASAGAISKGSQLRKIQRILQANGLWKDNHAQAAQQPTDLRGEDATNLQSTLSYLIQIHGGETIRNIFAPAAGQRDWARLNRWNAANDLLAALKITRVQSAFHSSIRNSNRSLAIDGFRRLWQVDQYSNLEKAWQPRRFDDVAIGLDAGLLKIATAEDATPQAVPLDQLLTNLPVDSAGEIPDRDLTVDFQRGTRSFRIVFQSVQVQKTASGPRLTGYQLYLLER